MADENQGDRSFVVLDIGGSQTRAGFAGTEVPAVQLPTVLSRFSRDRMWTLARGLHPRLGEHSPISLLPQYVLRLIAECSGMTDVFPGCCGCENNNLSEIEFRSLVDSFGDVCDWLGMQFFVEQIFTRLRVSPSSVRVLLIEDARATSARHDGMIELLLGRLHVQQLYLVTPGYSTWLVCGGCARVDRLYCIGGDAACSTEPTSMTQEKTGEDTPYHTIQMAVTKTLCGGRAMTLYLMNLLGLELPKEGDNVWNNSDFLAVQEAKEKYAYCALDPKEEETKCLQESKAKETNDGDHEIKLSNGKSVTMSKQLCFQCAEVLFNPALLAGLEEQSSLPKLIHAAWERVDGLPRMKWYYFAHNILLTGGLATLPGLPARLQKELKLEKGNDSDSIRVQEPYSESKPRIDSWVGGALLASLSFFQLPPVSLPAPDATRQSSVAFGKCCVCQKDISFVDSMKVGFLFVHRKCLNCSSCGRRILSSTSAQVITDESGTKIYCPDHIPARPQGKPDAQRATCIVCHKSVHPAERAKVAVPCHRACCHCSTCGISLRADNCFTDANESHPGPLFCAVHFHKK